MSGGAHAHFSDDQRLAFGRVAELYDRARPSYPAAAIDALLQYGALVPGVTIVEGGFEAWEPGETFDAVVSVQAWHWVDPSVRYAKAHQALAPRAMLAALWSLPDWARCPERDALSRAYRSAPVTLAPDFPMHPDSEPTRLTGDWGAEVTASGAFGTAEVRVFTSSVRYTGAAYAALLCTHQDHILLADGARTALMGTIERCIEGAGGSLELPLTTYVCLARRL